MYHRVISYFKKKITIRNVKSVRTALKTAGLMIGLFVFTSASVSAITETTIISSTIDSVITLTTNGTVNVDVTPTGSGAQTVANDTATVSTNSSTGYTLQLSTTTATTALESGANSIPAHTGTQASPTALAANTWGYRVDGVGGFGAGPTSGSSNQPISSATYAGVPSNASPVTLKTTSGVASNDATDVWYSVAANTTQPSGTYTQSVTYTATAN